MAASTSAIILVTEVTTIVLSMKGCTAASIMFFFILGSTPCCDSGSGIALFLPVHNTSVGHYCLWMPLEIIHSLRYHYDVATSYSQSKWCCHLIDNGNICYYVIMFPSCIPMLRCLSLSPQDGVTPLRLASERGHEEVVRLLLQSGSQQQPDQVRETITTIEITFERHVCVCPRA